MELFHLYPGVDHLLPDEECDVYPCYELYGTYGGGLADRDLTHVPPMPLRMCGTPIGRTHMLTGVRPFLVMTPRLLHFLESLGDFPHQVIPAHLVPDRDDWRDHPPIDTTSFVVCNLHKHLHIIDFARCELRPDHEIDDICFMQQLALVEGVTVPPLFRQDDWCLPPLIPRSTRDALIEAGFTDLQMPPLQDGMIRRSDIKLPPW
jgi:hypothetical protein